MKIILITLLLILGFSAAACATSTPENLAVSQNQEAIENQKDAIAARIERQECNPTYNSCK